MGTIIKTRDFDRSFQSASSALSVARNGLKSRFHRIILTRRYQDPPVAGCSATLALQQVFTNDVDVINHVEAGFIGPWGEWHSSNLGNPPTVSNMTAVLFRLLSVLPAERMVMIRRPMFKRQILPCSIPERPDADVSKADGSTLRGWRQMLPCFKDTNWHHVIRWSRAMIGVCRNEARYTPFGGESSYSSSTSCIYSCTIQPQNWKHFCENLKELVRLDKQIWTDEGCMDEIKRRKGTHCITGC